MIERRGERERGDRGSEVCNMKGKDGTKLHHLPAHQQCSEQAGCPQSGFAAPKSQLQSLRQAAMLAGGSQRERRPVGDLAERKSDWAMTSEAAVVRKLKIVAVRIMI
jgi:hypothetical protein